MGSWLIGRYKVIDSWEIEWDGTIQAIIDYDYWWYTIIKSHTVNIDGFSGQRILIRELILMVLRYMLFHHNGKQII